jgi:hypothetical protein
MSPLKNGLMLPDEVARLIEAGHCLMVAGDEALLRLLPSGQWIGGTIPTSWGMKEGR